jgi:acyltransferase
LSICCKKERIAWIDIAKAIAIFFIVLGHQLPSGPLCGYLYSFHVPLFFFLSGLTFNNAKEPKKFFCEKVKRILIPYFIFSSISIGFYIITNYFFKKSGLSLTQCLLGMIIGTRSTGLMLWNNPLWFLPCLFVLLSAAYIINRFVFRGKNKIKYTVILLAFSVSAVIILYCFRFYPSAPFGIIQAVNASPYFIIGRLAKQLIYKDGKVKAAIPIWAKVIASLILILGGAFLSSLNTRTDFAMNDFGKLWIYIPAAVVGIFGWCLLASTLRSAGLAYIGRHTMPILLMHKFPIQLYGFLPISTENTVVSILLSFCTVALCLAAAWIYDRIISIFTNDKG